MSDTAPRTPFTHLEGDLAWTVAEHRPPSEAIATAKHLLAADDGPHELLGLTAGCERAVFWLHLTRMAVEVSFDADGVEDPGSVEPDFEGPRRKGEYLKREADRREASERASGETASSEVGAKRRPRKGERRSRESEVGATERSGVDRREAPKTRAGNPPATRASGALEEASGGAEGSPRDDGWAWLHPRHRWVL